MYVAYGVLIMTCSYVWSFGLIKINNYIMMKVFHKEQPLYLTNKAQEKF